MIVPQPDLLTTRLRLRQFTVKDAPEVSRLGGDPAISKYTTEIPSPYDLKTVRSWIHGLPILRDQGTGLFYAVTLQDGGTLVGAIGLSGIEPRYRRARAGYWIGLPFWNRGYATEALQALIDYGFRERELNRIYSYCMTCNRASWRVLQKCGMELEGTLRQHIIKEDLYRDIAVLGILKEDHLTRSPRPG